MILFNDVNIDNIKFKKLRGTSSGSKIIDFDYIGLIQTGWCEIIYDVDYGICTEVTPEFRIFLEKLDTKIINHCSEVLDLCPQALTEMYIPLLRPNKNGHYFRLGISTTSILFDKESNYYNKSEMKDVLKKRDFVRFIFKFKKLNFKDHILKVQTEMIQTESN
jgi:hypothetical protein